MKKLRVIWSPTSDTYVIPDPFVEQKVRINIREFNEGVKDYNVYVGAEIIILAFRLAVKESQISSKDIVFIFDGFEYSVNKDGRFTRPVLFDSMYDNLLQRLL